MPEYAITIEGIKAHIVTPYHPKFVKEIKNIGGHWNLQEKTWDIPVQAVEVARKLMREIYGRDDTEPLDLIDIRATFSEISSVPRGPYVLFGRIIASASGRDSGARVGDKCAFIEKKPQSGGSRMHWETVIPAGTVVEVYEIPAAMVTDDNTPRGCTVERIDHASADIARAALLAEKARLEARIAQIDQLLNDQKK